MNDRDKAYLLKELTRTIDESDSTAAFCLCQRWILKDALALLKAQEPRVISWQDAESMRLCWIETRYPHTISPADLIHYYDEGPTITVFKIHQNAIDLPLDEYGIKWRCWDKEPTNEQMEAEPWQE